MTAVTQNKLQVLCYIQILSHNELFLRTSKNLIWASLWVYTGSAQTYHLTPSSANTPQILSVYLVVAWPPILQHTHTLYLLCSCSITIHLLWHYKIHVLFISSTNSTHQNSCFLMQPTKCLMSKLCSLYLKITSVRHLSATDNISTLTQIKYNLPHKMWWLQWASCYWSPNTCEWKYHRMAEVTPSNSMQSV
jgi:hypothetical protein